MSRRLFPLFAQPALHRSAATPLLTLVLLLTVGADIAPARHWEYIVIHHSATATGSAEAFDAAHRARGMVNGLAYHFVIDNGRESQPDGFIETGDRWVRQIHGGHCRQQLVNERSIGICLVGDFSKKAPSAKQLDALVLLIRGLQQQFKIPDDHVLGHGEIAGENSECPGKEFPWLDLRERLKGERR